MLVKICNSLNSLYFYKLENNSTNSSLKPLTLKPLKLIKTINEKKPSTQ